MKLKDSFIIFFISIITLVAEFILYLIFGIGTAFSGDFKSISGIAIFFVSLMIFTAAIGVLSPVCAFIGFVTKKEKVGNIILIILLSLVVIFLIVVSLNFNKYIKEFSTLEETGETIIESTEETTEETTGEKPAKKMSEEELIEASELASAELKEEVRKVIEDDFGGKLTKFVYDRDNYTIYLAYNSKWAGEDTTKKEIFDIVSFFVLGSCDINLDIVATDCFGDNHHSYTKTDILIKMMNYEISYEEWLDESFQK